MLKHREMIYALQVHNTKANWGGAHTCGSLPMCLGIVHLL